MYTATVLLAVNRFVPMQGVTGESSSIAATVFPPKDTSPPSPQSAEVFSGNGESIVVTTPKGYAGSVQLTYQLPDPRYVLLGIAFKNPNGGVGRVEFRSVGISRDIYGSQMTVIDSCVNPLDGVDYTYVILVQEVVSGNIGLIDPDWENENGE
jgi:hypothetical protein